MMGFGNFGSSSSALSINTSTSTEVNKTKNMADYSTVDGSQSKIEADIEGSNNNFNMLDGGAIAKSFEFGASIIEVNKDAMALVGAADQRASEIARTAVENTAPDTAISKDLIKYAALAAALFAIVYVWGKK